MVARRIRGADAGDRRARRAQGRRAADCGRRRPATSRVDWPGPAADPDANAAEVERIFASAKHVARVVDDEPAHRASPRWSRAAPPRATMRRATSTRCAPARRAPAPCARTILGIMNWPKETRARHHRGRRRRVRAEDRRLSGIHRASWSAPKKLGRPVHWMSSRSEAFLTDNQARDIYSEVELALDEKGKFLALRMRNVGNIGAYIGAGRRQHPDAQFHPLPARHVRHQAYRRRRTAASSPTRMPTAPYRGAGRPEASYVARARGRRGGAHHRHRSDQAAPAQPDQGNGHAVQDRGRHHLSTAAISSRSSTRRWRSPTTTASSSAGARRRSAASIAASASAACSNTPAARRPKARC